MNKGDYLAKLKQLGRQADDTIRHIDGFLGQNHSDDNQKIELFDRLMNEAKHNPLLAKTLIEALTTNFNRDLKDYFGGSDD